MSDQSNNERQRKLDEFAQSLNKPMSDRYFDEDDLAFIFDLANDAGDYYLMNEALLLGARLYPDSDIMAQRKALYYRHEEDGNNTLRRYLTGNTAREGVMWDTMRLMAANPTRAEAAKALSAILDENDSFNEEEVIQYCSAADALGCGDLLFKSVDRLKAKAEYLPGLLYELHIVAGKAGDYHNAVKYCEELTDLEPYNIQFWVSLGEMAITNSDWKRLKEASDFAVAIDPCDPEAMTLKLRYLTEVGVEAANYAEECLKHHPDNASMMPYILNALHAECKNTRANAVGNAFFRRHPDNFGAAFYLTINTYGSTKRVVKSLLDARLDLADDETTFINWAQRLITAQKYIHAKELLESYAALTKNTAPLASPQYFYSLYCCQDFETIVGLYTEELFKPENFNAEIIWIVIHALLACGKKEIATIWMEIFNNIPVNSPFVATGESRMEFIALKKLVSEASLFEATLAKREKKKSKSSCEDDEKSPWRYFDPLEIWDEDTAEVFHDSDPADWEDKLG